MRHSHPPGLRADRVITSGALPATLGDLKKGDRDRDLRLGVAQTGCPCAPAGGLVDRRMGYVTARLERREEEESRATLLSGARRHAAERRARFSLSSGL